MIHALHAVTCNMLSARCAANRETATKTSDYDSPAQRLLAQKMWSASLKVLQRALGFDRFSTSSTNSGRCMIPSPSRAVNVRLTPRCGLACQNLSCPSMFVMIRTSLLQACIPQYMQGSSNLGRCCVGLLIFQYFKPRTWEGTLP